MTYVVPRLGDIRRGRFIFYYLGPQENFVQCWDADNYFHHGPRYSERGACGANAILGLADVLDDGVEPVPLAVPELLHDGRGDGDIRGAGLG